MSLHDCFESGQVEGLTESVNFFPLFYPNLKISSKPGFSHLPWIYKDLGSFYHEFPDFPQSFLLYLPVNDLIEEESIPS